SSTSAPASQRACQSSPATATCPTGRHGVTTRPRLPISVSAPARTLSLLTVRDQPNSSTLPRMIPAANAIQFHGSGRTMSRMIPATISIGSGARAPARGLAGERVPEPRLLLGGEVGVDQGDVPADERELGDHPLLDRLGGEQEQGRGSRRDLLADLVDEAVVD